MKTNTIRVNVPVPHFKGEDDPVIYMMVMEDFQNRLLSALTTEFSGADVEVEIEDADIFSVTSTMNEPLVASTRRVLKVLDSVIAKGSGIFWLEDGVVHYVLFQVEG